MAPSIADKMSEQHEAIDGRLATTAAAMYAYARILRLADGPDEVHRGVVAKLELLKYKA